MNDSAGFSSLAFGCTWFREVCSGVIFCMRSANWIVWSAPTTNRRRGPARLHVEERCQWAVL